jgi:hypothetical protein
MAFSNIQLNKAVVSWPIRPAERAAIRDQKSVVEKLAYAVQHQALVWNAQPFTKEIDTEGYKAILNLPLTNVALTFTGEEGVTHQSPIIKGELEIQLNGLIVSGIEVTPAKQADDNKDAQNGNYLDGLPIEKRTILKLNFTARLSELFKHRRPQQSFFRFFLPDTLLDIERARDIVLACADTGFRLYAVQPDQTVPELQVDDYAHLENGRILIKRARIFGIRNNRYHDIQLILFLRCYATPITREKHYEDVHETTNEKSFSLEVTVLLRGKGEDVGQEMGHRQMQLFDLLRQRLQQFNLE